MYVDPKTNDKDFTYKMRHRSQLYEQNCIREGLLIPL